MARTHIYVRPDLTAMLRTLVALTPTQGDGPSYRRGWLTALAAMAGNLNIEPDEIGIDLQAQHTVTVRAAERKLLDK